VGRVSNGALCGVRTALQSDFLDSGHGRVLATRGEVKMLVPLGEAGWTWCRC
jgi:hypothetical protein